MSAERHTRRIETLTKENNDILREIRKLKHRHNLNEDAIVNLKKKRGDTYVPYPDYIE